MKLTVIIITKDQQANIADCVESAMWADEVLVVDTGSSDMTPDIAKELGARIEHIKDGSFDTWRNHGLKKAKGDWVFYLDSDERITPSLRDEITKLSNAPINKNSAYAVPRKNFIFGKEFKYGGEYPDYQKRLFKRANLKRWVGSVHERPVFDGEMGYLKNSITHLKHSNLSEMIDKTNDWSAIEAKLMYDSHHPKMNIVRFATAVLREFWDRMIKKQGFRDGVEGIIYSLYQVFSRFVSYAKLWELQEMKNS